MNYCSKNKTFYNPYHNNQYCLHEGPIHCRVKFGKLVILERKKAEENFILGKNLAASHPLYTYSLSVGNTVLIQITQIKKMPLTHYWKKVSSLPNSSTIKDTHFSTTVRDMMVLPLAITIQYQIYGPVCEGNPTFESCAEEKSWGRDIQFTLGVPNLRQQHKTSFY